MAHKYQRRRKNAANETVALLVIGSLVPFAALTGSDGSVSTGTIVALITIGLCVGAAILAYAFYINFRHQKALRLLDLAAVDGMSGIAFERWVGAQLQARGYKIRFTPINDYGVDIVAKKDGIRTAVQVKRYRKYLDQKPVREAVAGMMHYKCGRSMVITNSHFSQAAKVLAQSNRCELIDRDKLADWLTK